MNQQGKSINVLNQYEGRKTFLHITGLSVHQLEAFLSDQTLKRALEENTNSEFMQDTFLYQAFKERHPESNEEFASATGYHFSRRQGWASFEQGIGGMQESQAREVQYFLDTCESMGFDMQMVGHEVTRLVGKLHNPEDEAYILSKEEVFGLDSYGIRETAMDDKKKTFYLPFSMPFVDYLSFELAPLLQTKKHPLTGEELQKAVYGTTRRYVVTHTVDTSHYSVEKKNRILGNVLCYLFKKRNDMDITYCQFHLDNYPNRIEPKDYQRVVEIESTMATIS